ncbi:MAG: tRNA pseudouridine(38-40) synthase TruA [Bacillota bacterium]|nr:tRNA pseudouridine(38-40) synthase TruA [Bacillota bacterium]
MKKNVLLTIAYDGSGFHGWQKQPGVRTVQGHLEQVMSRLFNREILLSGTSRTDAGVHARGQRASFRAEPGIPVEKMALVINNALCAAEKGGGYAKSPVRILKAEEVQSDFHARFSCKSKRYVYRIIDGVGIGACGSGRRTDDPRNRDYGTGMSGDAAGRIGDAGMSLVFDRNYVYHVKELLNEEAMREAAGHLEGTHDFKSFEASGGNPRESTVRTVMEARIRRTGGEIEFSVRGDGFLYNMVRIITGTLVETGQGKRKPEDIIEIIEAKDRSRAGHTAPPNGLYLAEVFYE